MYPQACILAALFGASPSDVNPGVVVAWGDDGFGQTTVPEGLMAVQVDTLSDHTVARTPEGGVVAWGRNAIMIYVDCWETFRRNFLS